MLMLQSDKEAVEVIKVDVLDGFCLLVGGNCETMKIAACGCILAFMFWFQVVSI